jgi:hypothetical protein
MKILDIAILTALIGALAVGAYAMWISFPFGEEEYGRYSTDLANNGAFDDATFSSGLQFYPSMRFSDRNISYRLESACTPEKWESIKNAFAILESRTILRFYLSDDASGINVLCSEVHEEKAEREGYFVAGEGGPTEAINMSTFTVISAGKISLYKDEQCKSPQVAIHEILHALGFGHINKTESIMYPITSCKQEIDAEIINEINRLYKADSLPDLLIESINASRKGRYLNFDAWTANLGLKQSGEADMIVYADGSKIDEFELGNLEIGMKKRLSVENLKVPSGAAKILFSVATRNNEAELDMNNNRAEIMLAG